MVKKECIVSLSNDKRGITKTKIIILGFVFGVVVLGGLIYLLYYFDFLIFGSPEGECVSLIENSGDKKIDIVFFSEGVSRGKIEDFMNYFLDSDAFVDDKEKFNFYYAGNAICEIMDEKALYCYSKKLIRDSSVCPNDYVVVLSDQPNQIRSSAYMNVMSLNANSPKSVLLHEFGHAFANLADEYVPSIIPWGSKNCQSVCSEFDELNKEYGELEGCFVECSRSDYYRSSENSVMRTLKTDDFGILNSGLLGKELNNYE